MRKRPTSAQRREQIVDAALRLLAHTSIDKLTTRDVAREVGVSQPALFRHFRSRDALLEAVVLHIRAGLEAVAAGAFGETHTFAVIRTLVRGIVDFASAHPGVPRMLFHDAGAFTSGGFHKQLVRLLGQQRALITALVRDGQRQGRIPQAVDAACAGSFLIALLQGELLQARLLGRAAPASRQAETIATFWWTAMQQGVPPASITAGARQTAADEPSGLAHLLALDVRPLIAAGQEPLDLILERLDQLADDGLLRITAPFRPSPLLALLQQRGYRVTCVEGADGAWELEAAAPNAPMLLDLRDLPAPEPMQRLLARVGELAVGQALLAQVPHTPHPLLALLQERGLHFSTLEEFDGSAIIHIRRRHHAS